MGSSSERDKVLRTHPTTRAGARANTPFLLCHSFVRNSLITFDKFCPSTRAYPSNPCNRKARLYHFCGLRHCQYASSENVLRLHLRCSSCFWPTPPHPDSGGL